MRKTVIDSELRLEESDVRRARLSVRQGRGNSEVSTTELSLTELLSLSVLSIEYRMIQVP